jgi:hypothetical protein
MCPPICYQSGSRLPPRANAGRGTALCAQFRGGDTENFVGATDGHEMTGSLDRMPNRSGHPVGHRLVDGIRYQPIIQPLPHVDPTLDR